MNIDKTSITKKDLNSQILAIAQENHISPYGNYMEIGARVRAELHHTIKIPLDEIPANNYEFGSYIVSVLLQK